MRKYRISTRPGRFAAARPRTPLLEPCLAIDQVRRHFQRHLDLSNAVFAGISAKGIRGAEPVNMNETACI